MYLFQIIQVDVGQGDCTVIIIRNGLGNIFDPIVCTIVIDCGGGKNGVNNDDTNSGSSLLRVLDDHNVQHIDIVNISHYDQDHLGGIRSLLDRAKKSRRLRALFQNTLFYDRGEPGSYSTTDKKFTGQETLYNNYVDDLYILRSVHGLKLRRMTEFVNASSMSEANFNLKNTKFTTVQNVGTKQKSFTFTKKDTFIGVNLLESMGFPDMETISLRCVTVNRRKMSTNPTEKSSALTPGKGKENDFSMTLLFKFGEFSHWLSGELLKVDEELCIELFQNLCSNGQLSSMKLGHHGSNSSTSPIFIETLKVKTALISCGPNNKHKHPASGVLDILKFYNVTTLLTGWGGDPNYSPLIEYSHPFSNISHIHIAGSTLLGEMVEGDIKLIGNELTSEENQVIRMFHTQNFWYDWVSDDGDTDPFFNQYRVQSEAFFDIDGNLFPGIFITPQGSIGYKDDHYVYPGSYYPQGHWVNLDQYLNEN